MPRKRTLSSSKSEDAPRTPGQTKRRGTRSAATSTGSNASGRLTSLMNFEVNMSSFVLSPAPSRLSVLSDKTDIQEPRRISWWRRLDENSREVMEVLKHGEEPNHVLGDLDIEVFSQEQKKSHLELPESSDSESIASIVLPQRQLFTQNENHPPKNYNELIGSRDTMNKQSKSQLNDDIINMNTKELFQSKPRSKPVFPSALLNLTNNQTIDIIKESEMLQRNTRNIFRKNEAVRKNKLFAQFVSTDSRNSSSNSTKEIDSQNKPLREIFGTNSEAKRKNVFAEFVGSEIENMSTHENIDNASEGMKCTNYKLSKNIFGNNCEATRKKMFSKFVAQSEDDVDNDGDIPQIRVTSPTSSYTTDVEMDEWVQLPSSTMMEHELQDALITPIKILTPLRKTRSQNLSQQIEAVSSNITIVNTSKQANKSNTNVNKSKSSPIRDNSRNKDASVSRVTRSKSKTSFTQNNNTTLKGLENNVSIHMDAPGNDNSSRIKSNLSLRTKSGAHKDTSKPSNTTAALVNQTELHELPNISTSKSKQKSKTITLDEPNSSHTKRSTEKVIQTLFEDIVDELGDKNFEKDGDVEWYDEVKNHSLHDMNNSHENFSARPESNDKDNQLLETSTENNKKISNDVDEEEKIETDDNNGNTINKCIIQEVTVNEDGNQEDTTAKEDKTQENSILKEGSDQEDLMEKEDSDQEDSSEKDDKEDFVAVENVNQEDSSKDEDINQEDSSKEEANHEDSSREVADEREDENDSEDIESQENDQETDDSKEINLTYEEIEQSIENETNSSDNINLDKSDTQYKTEVSDNDNESVDNDVEHETEVADKDEGCDNYQYTVENESFDDEANDEIADNDDGNQSSSNDHESTSVSNNKNANGINISESDEETAEGRKDKMKNFVVSQSSPEAVLRINTSQDTSYQAPRKTSLHATKSIIKDLNLKPSLLPPRESTGLSDGTRYSSMEGSGWDSHRTTRKTLRQTFGRDFTPRKSLRALVMEKSAKRQTALNDLQVLQGNPTELAISTDLNDYEQNVSNHDQSIQMREVTMKMDFTKHVVELRERLLKMREEATNSLKTFKAAPRDPFKVPTKPPFATREKKIAKKKPKKEYNYVVPLDMLPRQFLKDLKYKPPKKFQPRNAGWTTKRLYKFLESKLEPKYSYRARVRAERLVEDLYEFVNNFRKVPVATPDAIDAMKWNMARLNIVTTHHDFYIFFHEYMPKEVRFKVIPDLMNKLPMPRDLYGPILDEHT